jgi:hypothetical protein
VLLSPSHQLAIAYRAHHHGGHGTSKAHIRGVVRRTPIGEFSLISAPMSISPGHVAIT